MICPMRLLITFARATLILGATLACVVFAAAIVGATCPGLFGG